MMFLQERKCLRPSASLKILALLMVSAAFPIGSDASTITLFNTGVNADGSLAATGTVDQHYTSAGTTVYVIPSFGIPWANPGTAANYVAPDTNQGSTYNGGSYTLGYVIAFDLTGLNPASVLIQGAWTTDNTGNDVLVNGHSTGNTASLSAFTPFTLSGGSGLFTSGINTLDFVWTNAGYVGGVAVIFSSANATSAVPEPASLVMLGAGLAVMFLLARRYRKLCLS